MIHKANLHDTKIGYWATALATFTYPTLQKICADGGYRGSFVYEAYKYFGLRVEISKKVSQDYELTITSAQTLIKISHIHTLLKRL